MLPLARALALALILAVPGLAPSTARAFDGRVPGQTPLDDVLQIVILPREVLALDAEGGGDTRQDLELGEEILWYASRGRVAVVITNRRLLAVTPRSGSWQEARYHRRELAPEYALLGDRVALAVTSRRAIGFDGGSGNLVEKSIGPGENVLGMEISGNVGVVVTQRRALGLSPFTGGFFQVSLRTSEDIEDISATGNFATIRTSRRLLTFRAPSGSWGERRLDLR